MAENNTETIPRAEEWLDRLDDDAALAFMAANQAEAHDALRRALPEIAIAAKAVLARLEADDSARLFYAGAGTSARIGVQDGVELTPTFGWDTMRLGFFIAGGDPALLQSVEGAEDDTDAALRDVAEARLGTADCVIGISASGATPYTCAVIAAAREAGALTIGIANNPGSRLVAAAEYGITLATGGEAVAGSTRMKAGTAQKICLNMISTLVMVRMGKVERGMMVAMQAGNEKLRKRAKRIAAVLGEGEG